MKRWNLLEKIMLGAFLFWSAAGLIFTLSHITPDIVAHWSVPAWLEHFVVGCLQTGDPILILLAFANTHLHAARQWSPATARRWGLIILAAAFAVETLGAETGFPFGHYHYTDHFGPMLGVIPLTIPFAWHIVVTNALFVVRALFPHAPRGQEAALAALLCMAYDFILEPFATRAKGYWIWADGTIPLSNYIAWFVVSGSLVFFFAPSLANRFRADPRPGLILGLTILIYLAGRWAAG
ncbi:MAG: carotenoid biosynthesis protein [Methylacidiphilales bacterium]|nr:carotenoid biosynthesis protein [Candidatus Methylacidiphilales bacterium]